MSDNIEPPEARRRRLQRGKARECAHARRQAETPAQAQLRMAKAREWQHAYRQADTAEKA